MSEHLGVSVQRWVFLYLCACLSISLVGVCACCGSVYVCEVCIRECVHSCICWCGNVCDHASWGYVKLHECVWALKSMHLCICAREHLLYVCAPVCW